MATYKNTNQVIVSEDQLTVLKRLLDLDSTDDFYNPENSNKNDKEIDGFTFNFENGFKLNFDVICGEHNYYDNVYLNDSEGYEVCIFDCSYTIDEQMEFEYNNDTYIVEFKVVEGRDLYYTNHEYYSTLL